MSTPSNAELAQQRATMNKLYDKISDKDLVARVVMHVFHSQLFAEDRELSDVVDSLVTIDGGKNFSTNVANVKDDVMQPAQDSINVAYKETLELACNLRNAMSEVPTDSDQHALVTEFLKWVQKDPLSALTAKLNDDLARAEKEAELNGTALQRANEHIAQLNDARNKADENIRTLRTLVNEKDASLDDCARARGQFETENAALEAEIERKRALLDSLNDQDKQEQDRIMDLGQELDDTREALEACQSDLDQHRAKVAELEKGLEDANAHAATSDAQLEKVQTEAADALEREAQLNEKVRDLDTQLQDAKQMNNGNQLNNRDLMRKLNDAEDALAQARLRAEAATKKSADLEKANAAMDGARKTQDELVNALTNQLRQCKGEIGALGERIVELETKLKECEEGTAAAPTPSTLNDMASKEVPEESPDMVGWQTQQGTEYKWPAAHVFQVQLSKTSSNADQDWVPVESWVYAWNPSAAATPAAAIRDFYTKRTTPKPAMDSIIEDEAKQRIFSKHAAPPSVASDLSLPQGIPLNLSDSSRGANPFMFSNAAGATPAPLSLRFHSKPGDDGNSSEYDAPSASFIVKVNENAGLDVGDRTPQLKYRVLTLWADTSNRFPVQLSETNGSVDVATLPVTVLSPPELAVCPPCPGKTEDEELNELLEGLEETDEEQDEQPEDEQEVDEILKELGLGEEEGEEDKKGGTASAQMLELVPPTASQLRWDKAGQYLEAPYSTKTIGSGDGATLGIQSVKVRVSRTTQATALPQPITAELRSYAATAVQAVTLSASQTLLVRIFGDGAAPVEYAPNIVNVVFPDTNNFPHGPKQNEGDVLWRWLINIEVFGSDARPLIGSTSLYWDSPPSVFNTSHATAPVGTNMNFANNFMSHFMNFTSVGTKQ